MAWHDTWREMRGARLNGMSLSEVLRDLKASGYDATEWKLRRCIKAGHCSKPTKHYGGYRFTEDHLNQLRAFFESRQQRRAECATS